MVSNGVSVVPVRIVNAPAPIVYAGRDLETDYLFITFSKRSSRVFLGVPRRVFQYQPVQWVNIAIHTQALMQEGSPCPLLYENNLPIWSCP
jgi:hypothetical protein